MKPLILTVSEECEDGDYVRRYEITVDVLTGEAQICSTRSGHAERDRSVEVTVGDEPTAITITIGVEVAP